MQRKDFANWKYLSILLVAFAYTPSLIADEPGFAETDAQAKLAIETNPNWTRFSLYDENTTNESMKYIVKLNKLKSLYVSGTNITDEGFQDIQCLETLKRLDLNTFKITNKTLDYVANLKNLKVLSLTSVPISDSGLKKLAKLESLTELEIWYTLASGETLNGLKHLKILKVCGEKITNKGVAAIGALRGLQELQLHAKGIDGNSILSLKNLENLRELTLSGSKITLDDILQLSTLQRLTFLSLDDIKVSDSDLLKFQIFPHLNSIRLNETAVTESAIRALKKIRPNIQVSNRNPTLVDALTNDGKVLDINGNYKLGISNSSYGFNSPDSIGGAGISLNVKINLVLTINNKMKITYDGGGMCMPLNDSFINGVIKAGRNSVFIKNIPPAPLYLSIVETRGVDGKRKKFLLHKILNSKNSTSTQEFFFNILK